MDSYCEHRKVNFVEAIDPSYNETDLVDDFVRGEPYAFKAIFVAPWLHDQNSYQYSAGVPG